jgi:hypothetical protein
MLLLNSSLPVYQKAYGNEEACLQAVFETKWPRGFVCPYCEHNGGWQLKDLRTMQCASCHRQTSITANTIFQDSHLPLPLLFLAIYFVANDKGGVSAMKLGKQLGVHRMTAHLLLQKIRVAMGTRDKNMTLAGYIELDEGFFGGRRSKKAPGESPFEGKVQVLVMVESENMAAGNLVMTVIPDTNIETLKEAINRKVDSDPPGHSFRADGLTRHHIIRALGHHVNMAVMTKAELNTQMACLSLAISHAKRFFKGTYHHFCKLHIQNYLDEFCYRWNRRHLENQLASHLLTACVLHPAVPAKVTKYNSLVAIAA